MNISMDMVHLPAAEMIPLENTKNVVLVDAMVVVKSVEKTDTIKTCSELADHFMQHVVKNIVNTMRYASASIDMIYHVH